MPIEQDLIEEFFRHKVVTTDANRLGRWKNKIFGRTPAISHPIPIGSDLRPSLHHDMIPRVIQGDRRRRLLGLSI
jgi:hypothetical protein